MFFPQFRARRIRGSETFRRMVRETSLSVDDLVYPMFSAFGSGIRKEISSMPGIYQQSIENIVAEAKEVRDLGIPAVLLFGIPETKDAVGSDAYSDTGIIQETIRALKRMCRVWRSLPTSACASTLTTVTADNQKRRCR